MRFEASALKMGLAGSRGAKARYHLSDSYCEPLSPADLLLDDAGLVHQFLSQPLGYTALNGSEALRAAIADWHAPLSADQVLATNGGDDALMATMLAVLNPGDHVVVQHPSYSTLQALPAALGCRVDQWACRPEASWAPDLEELASITRGGTVRLIVINHPHNPTGFAFTRRELQTIIDLATACGAVILADEIYRGIVIDPSSEVASLASLDPRAVSIGSVSKSLGMPGLRVGWLATQNKTILRAAAAVLTYFGSFVTASGELLGTMALERREPLLACNNSRVHDNLQRLDRFFAKHSDLFSWVRPLGGTVAFAEYRQGSAAVFADELLNTADVLLVPSTTFGLDDRHLRFGFGTAGMAEALDALEAALGRCGQV